MTREPTIADELHGHWHKVAAVLAAKLGNGDVRLEPADFEAIDGKSVVVSHENEGRTLRVRVLPEAEATRLGEDFQRAARRKQ